MKIIKLKKDQKHTYIYIYIYIYILYNKQQIIKSFKTNKQINRTNNTHTKT